MNLKIKTNLEVTVAINDLKREVSNLKINAQTSDKRINHNSKAIVENQKSLTVANMGEAV